MSLTPIKLNEWVEIGYQTCLKPGLKSFVILSIFNYLFGGFRFLQFLWMVTSLTLLLQLFQKKPNLGQEISSSNANDIIVVTGGSSGIGMELVKLLLSQNNTNKVIVIDRLDLEGMDTFKDSGRLFFYKCDVSDSAQVDIVSKEIIKKGHPTKLVNNAGVVTGKKLLDASISEIERTIKVNVLAHFYLIKAFLPGFIKQKKGHILSVGSVMGLTGAAYAVDYCASKFAVTGYMESLRQELKGTGVYCSTIYPGLIDTGMFTGVKHHNDWISPKLEPIQVSKAMVDLLSSESNQEMHMPFYSRLIPYLRLLPLEINDLVHILTGANTDLAGFSHSTSSRKIGKLE